MKVNIIIGLCNVGVALLVTALSQPLIKGKVKPNHLYGIRFKKSHESEENWYEINRYGGKRLVFWSGVLLMIGIASFFVPMEETPWLAIPFAIGSLVYTIAGFECWRYQKKF